ncbi:LacI family transcriptional regulator [Puniceicoccaceae bacterium K14]|nr:LacI family transcriptional regulator [Puniceicoccaceae bacterium K14]
MPQKRIVMKDVAREAGVHQTTVSLALRDHPSLPQETRKRIKKLAIEMGYRPDPALTALNNYRERVKSAPTSHSIGLIINLASEAHLKESHVHEQLIRHSRERAKELGYNLDIFWYGRDYHRSKGLDNVLKTRAIPGLILSAFSYINTDIQLDWDAYSTVKINLLPVGLEVDAILSNQLFAVRLAMRKLRERGIKRIGLAIAEHDEIHTRNLFTGGFYIGQRTYHATERIPPLVFKPKPMPLLSEQVKDYCIEHKLDALMSNWNILDICAWQATEALGRDCRFVTLDLNDSSRPYGGVNQNHDQVARTAVDQVVGKINTFQKGTSDSHNMTLVDPSWEELKPWIFNQSPEIKRQVFVPSKELLVS